MLTKKKVFILSIALFALVASLMVLFLIPSKTSRPSEVTSSELNPSVSPLYRTGKNNTITATPILPTISLAGAPLIPTVIPTAFTASTSPTLIPSASASASISAYISTTPTVIPLSPAITSIPRISSASAITPTPGEITLGRLSYIQDKDIYNTDLKTTNLLVKNDSTPSGNLKWSPKGSYLSWTQSYESTQSAIVVYSINTKKTKTIPLEIPLISEYFYSPDEKQISVMYGGSPNQIASINLETNTFIPESFFASPYPVSFITSLKNGEILFGGKNGIFLYSLPRKTWTPVADQQGIDDVSVSPDETKLLYSVSQNDTTNWYIKDLTGSASAIVIKPKSFDFTSVNLPNSQAEKGFDNKAVWFPSPDKIFLSIKYLREFPIVGIYDVSLNTFKAVSIFHLQNNDFMSDPYTLVGEREVSKNGSMESQVQLFSIEGQAKLGLIKVIPNASSPAFYSGN